MKFIRNDGSELQFLEEFSTVSKDISPIKEMLARKDFSNYSFVDEEVIPFSEITPIAVNVIDVGVMFYFFRKETFNKEEFINEVSKLKEMQITSFYDVLNKMKTLYTVSSLFNPLFVIYSPMGKYRIYEDCFKTTYSNIKTIYVSDTENSSISVSPNEPLVSEIKQEKHKIKKEKGERKKFSFNFKIKLFNPIPIIQKDKFHFLFALIATFLIGFTMSIGIYNAYSGKMICIFFFICCVAGLFLNFLIYRDTFKHGSFDSPLNIITIITSIIGLGLSIGGYFIFKSLSIEKLDNPPSILMIIVIIIGVYLLSSISALVADYLKKRKK